MNPDSGEDLKAYKEHRSMIHMYLEAASLLTDVDMISNGLPNFPYNPQVNLSDICKFLSKEQMQLIPAREFLMTWPHNTLYDWHLLHGEHE